VAPVLAVEPSTAKKALIAALSGFVRPAQNATVDLPPPPAKLTEKGDASFSAERVEASVVPSRSGRSVNTEAAVSALRGAVAAGRDDVRLTVTETKPAVSTAEAAEVDQLIGTFTTEHQCCAPRVTNIHRIAELVDGSIIAPGGVFSLNAASGRRTAENGFVSAPAIADGELVDQFGGGVSQFSTTLFNAAWFSGLPILRHQPHSKYISRYPPGREATLDFDTIDQTIRNDTSAPVVIRTFTTDTAVTVALYGHTGDRRVDSTTGARVPRAEGGFSITVRRVVLDSGSVHRRDTLNWTYTGLD
jgi:vancomycin resistance protein YoaR